MYVGQTGSVTCLREDLEVELSLGVLDSQVGNKHHGDGVRGIFSCICRFEECELVWYCKLSTSLLEPGAGWCSPGGEPWLRWPVWKSGKTCPECFLCLAGKQVMRESLRLWGQEDISQRIIQTRVTRSNAKSLCDQGRARSYAWLLLRWNALSYPLSLLPSY